MESRTPPQNIQDAFLNAARRDKTAVTVYLVSGTKLQGRIRSFDKFSILLESGANDQLIFKHAISTIQHGRRPGGEPRAGVPHEHAPPEPHGDGNERADG